MSELPKNVFSFVLEHKMKNGFSCCKHGLAAMGFVVYSVMDSGLAPVGVFVPMNSSLLATLPELPWTGKQTRK